eukprot:s1277_g12.t1
MRRTKEMWLSGHQDFLEAWLRKVTLDAHLLQQRLDRLEEPMQRLITRLPAGVLAQGPNKAWSEETQAALEEEDEDADDADDAAYADYADNADNAADADAEADADAGADADADDDEEWGAHSFGVVVSDRLPGFRINSFGAQFRHSGSQFRDAGL